MSLSGFEGTVSLDDRVNNTQCRFAKGVADLPPFSYIESTDQPATIYHCVANGGGPVLEPNISEKHYAATRPCSEAYAMQCPVLILKNNSH
ncbi:MAG: hypothetical protein AABX51_00450 [Nanoarchaeota archaeon]